MGLPGGRARLSLALGAAACISAVGAVSLVHTFGFFNARAANSGNSFSVGTLTMSNGTNGAAVVTVTNMKPGDVTCGKVTVTNSGGLPSQIELAESQLSGSSGAAGTLGRYLQLDIWQDATVSGGSSCSLSDSPPSAARQHIVSTAFDSLSTTKVTGKATGSLTGTQAGDWFGGEGHTFVILVTLPSNPVTPPTPGATAPPTPSASVYQGLSVSAEFDWYGSQSRATVTSHS